MTGPEINGQETQEKTHTGGDGFAGSLGKAFQHIGNATRVGLLSAAALLADTSTVEAQQFQLPRFIFTDPMDEKVEPAPMPAKKVEPSPAKLSWEEFDAYAKVLDDTYRVRAAASYALANDIQHYPLSESVSRLTTFSKPGEAEHRVYNILKIHGRNALHAGLNKLQEPHDYWPWLSLDDKKMPAYLFSESRQRNMYGGGVTSAGDKYASVVASRFVNEQPPEEDDCMIPGVPPYFHRSDYPTWRSATPSYLQKRIDDAMHRDIQTAGKDKILESTQKELQAEVAAMRMNEREWRKQASYPPPPLKKNPAGVAQK